AGGDDDVGFVFTGVVQQAPDQLVGRVGADLRHMAAAAVGLERKVDALRPQRAQQAIEVGRVLGVDLGAVPLRPHDQAAVVGSHPQAVQWADDPRLERLVVDVFDDDVQQGGGVQGAR